MSIESIKAHFSKHRATYAGVGAGIGIGVVATTAVILRQNPETTASIIHPSQVAKVIGRDNTVNQVMINMVERSCPSKPVHLVGTDRYFASVSEAARALGLDRANVSKNVNGHIPSVKGHVFELLVPASQELHGL